ncbi:shikimate dehydrogenase [Paenibacillus septentrionalis]|uniref:Shikimate dehydrogenase (NADP(+)) n=1 Tax=Paenibacillus septentrionalis TaxID=429342 RepID=A0ABW1V135_9BACL
MELTKWREQQGDKKQLFCVIGDPIAQSKSPLMHNRAFQELGLQSAYGAFLVKEDQLEAFIKEARDCHLAGLNVTIPHKLNVMKYLDAIDQDAKELGAVNTIVNDNGRLIGYNTDGIGYVRSLKEEAIASLEHAAIVVIGAGGAARGIVHALLKEKPARIVLVNRSIDKAELLASSLQHNGVIQVCGLEQLQSVCADADVVINTTSVGMYPNEEEQPALGSWLKRGAVASDLIYNPLYTRFVEDAEKHGCMKHGGLGMFIYQGAYAFEYWTGLKAPVQAMREAVMEALAKR